LTKDLHEYPLTAKTVHLCVDMQRIFSAEGPWPTPWMERVLPVVTELAGRFPERTVFTRFVTPNKANDMPGMWQRYYAKWNEATREHLNPNLLELLPPLARLCPPATVVNKTRYSAFAEPNLLMHLQTREADGLVVTGSETDVCVLSTVLGAVDLGYRVIVVRDAVCSSSDTGHDALMKLYEERYKEQIELAEADAVIARWTQR
jgi:nicotinamidase-related amidase